jgi:succinate dehydrogenase/fumarate reductase flavoprotein subunit
VLIIGAGIAGLSAALEAARAGASVVVVDMSTVGGGHAILSNGAVSINGTQLQDSKRIADSPDLAEKDFLARGEDNDRRWVAAYVRDSKEWLYDWLSQLGSFVRERRASCRKCRAPTSRLLAFPNSLTAKRWRAGMHARLVTEIYPHTMQRHTAPRQESVCDVLPCMPRRPTSRGSTGQTVVRL